MKNLVLVINTMTSTYDTEFGHIHDCIKNTHDHEPNCPVGIDQIKSIIVDDSDSSITEDIINDIYFGLGATSRSNRFYNKNKLTTDWESLIWNKENRGLLYSRLVAIDGMKGLDPKTTWVRYYDASDSAKNDAEMGSYDKFPKAFGANDLLYDEDIDFSTIKWQEVGVTEFNTNEVTLSGQLKGDGVNDKLKAAYEMGLIDSHCFSKVYRLDKLIKTRKIIEELFDNNIPNIFHKADWLINYIYLNFVENFRSVSTQEILYFHNPGGQSKNDTEEKIAKDIELIDGAVERFKSIYLLNKK